MRGRLTLLACALALSGACESSASYRPVLRSPSGETVARVRLELVHVRTEAYPVPLFLEVGNASHEPLVLVADECRLTTAGVLSAPLRHAPEDLVVAPRTVERFRLEFPAEETLASYAHDAHLVFEQGGRRLVLDHRVWTEDYGMNED